MQVDKRESKEGTSAVFLKGIGGLRICETHLELSFRYALFDPNKGSCVR